LGEGSFKVRLLLNERGDTCTEVEKIVPIAEPVRVAFAREQTDRKDRFLYHKTTHRPLYLKASKMAPRLGLWDLLFTNREGEVTEGAISNVFASINGTWQTPPQDSGLLAGIMREELITKLRASIRPLQRGDLIDADRLLVSNSVRGPLEAQLVELPHATIQEL
jgi:para-aminobenzoate synthetase/4-amino-4-deoxychorismate lyase